MYFHSFFQEIIAQQPLLMSNLHAICSLYYYRAVHGGKIVLLILLISLIIFLTHFQLKCVFTVNLFFLYFFFISGKDSCFAIFPCDKVGVSVCDVFFHIHI